MDELKKLRRQINNIDDMLLKLLNSRSELAIKIGNVKKKVDKNVHLFRPERQASIIKRLIKQNTKINALDIFSMWRTIFFLQTKIQGKIEYYSVSSLSDNEKKQVFNFFGNEIDLKEVANFNKGFALVSKKSNGLLLLQYPTKNIDTQWIHLLGKNKLFVISSIPLILSIKKKPTLLVVSKNEPVLEGDNTYLYLSERIIKKKGVELLYKKRQLFVYQANSKINIKELILLGAYPSNILENKYEKSK